MGGSEENKYDHPCQKPVELARRPILNHLRRGELVYDAFLGSGTTLAAAELTECICYGIELDPKYVDVIIETPVPGTRGILELMIVEDSAAAIRAELDRALASTAFARDEGLSRFLRVVVEYHVMEYHIEGRNEELKESVIAIEVFGRHPDYNSKQDAIVRTEAGRLRARLNEYLLYRRSHQDNL